MMLMESSGIYDTWNEEPQTGTDDHDGVHPVQAILEEGSKPHKEKKAILLPAFLQQKSTVLV